MIDYAAIPSFICRPGCSDCCGPHPWTKAEHERIAAWLAERGRPLLRATGLDCPYIENGRCSIYEVRPFICRLYGTVEGLRCPHGCGPARLLSEHERRHLMSQYVEEMKAR